MIPHKSSPNSSTNNKFKLISEFVQQSARITKNSNNRHEFVSEVTRSREIITFEPDFEQEFQEKNHFSPEIDPKYEMRFDKKPRKSERQSLNLRDSYVKTEMDETTYQSLMHEFMGSYLEERLSSKNQQSHRSPLETQPHFSYYKYQSKQKPSLEVPILTKDNESPIDKQSQITFSGSKESRIINENQESRIVKEEYFLLDQLKNSRDSKNNKSQFEKSTKDRKIAKKSIGIDVLDKDKYFVEEAYRLRSPVSPQKLRQSLRKSRQQSSSNNKTTHQNILSHSSKPKVQKIDLIRSASSSKDKNRNKSPLKKPYKKQQLKTSKYNISKQTTGNKQSERKSIQLNSPSKINLSRSHNNQSHRKSYNSKSKDEPIVIHVNLMEQQEESPLKSSSRKGKHDDSRVNNVKFCNQSSHTNDNQKLSKESWSKSRKKGSILKINKTFNTSSVSIRKYQLQQKEMQKRQQIGQIYPITDKFRLSVSKKQKSPQRTTLVLAPTVKSQQPFKIAKDKPKFVQQQSSPSPTHLNTSQKAPCFINQPQNKYTYQYTYKMNNPLNIQPSFNPSSNSNNDHDNQPSEQSHQRQQVDIEKDREMIREIKQDLTKLISKITSSSTLPESKIRK